MSCNDARKISCHVPYKGTCHVILLAKLHDMYLYKTTNHLSTSTTKVNFKGGCFTQVLLYINLLKLSWMIKCLFLRNMEPLSRCKRRMHPYKSTMLHMKSPNETEIPIFVLLCVQCFQEFICIVRYGVEEWFTNTPRVSQHNYVELSA